LIYLAVNHRLPTAAALIRSQARPRGQGDGTGARFLFSVFGALLFAMPIQIPPTVAC
jgi:hypothetical protein